MGYQFQGNTGVVDHPRAGNMRTRSLAQILAFVFGATFLLVGVLGFVPGITTPFSELSFFGPSSDGELLGIFQVSVLHNVVHLLFGVGILAAARESWSLAYLLGGGIAYVLVAAYGFLIDHESDANFLPVNTADNLLHVALAAGLLGAGLVALAVSRRRRMVSSGRAR